MPPAPPESRPADGLTRGVDGEQRCFWAGTHPDYIAYHDEEWGAPVADDRLLFEKVCLEGFQSGLSWLTILRKRPSFREAFEGFEFERVAAFSQRHVERLLLNPGIVRHRGKIEAVINNARKACEMASEFGSLAAFFWQWEPGAETRPDPLDHAALLSLMKSAESAAMSKELKKRGWRFVGPTTLYAFMQAMGLVNDHIEGCRSRAGIEALRQEFARPAAPLGRALRPVG